MKLISLNTWGGKIYQPLIKFVKENAQSTDIFCFQEVFKTTSKIRIIKDCRTNLYGELSKILPDYQGYFSTSLQNYVILSRSAVEKTNFDLLFGLATFVKKKISVSSSGDFYIYGDKHSFNPLDLNTIPRNLQYVTFTENCKQYIICNLHGIWLKYGKGDTSSRLEQSRKINEFLNQQKGGKILCGDFNLDINTQSIEILEENLRNLIKEYCVATTRNKLYPGHDKFADYTFVSKGIGVNNFQIPNVEVSDHLPMILEFS